MAKNNQNRREDREKELYTILKKKRFRVHFIGIGGVSMYGLALLSFGMGAYVSGSDRLPSERVAALSARGIPVFTGHSPENIGEAEIVVYSHAISADNPELVFAKESGRVTVSRAEYLGAVMLGYKNRIGISGSHGKSTTTAMLNAVFEGAERAPTTLSGALLDGGEPFLAGGNEVLIYEACEYKDSFLSFSPTVAVAINLEMDHPDYFENIAHLRDSFTKALSRATSFALISLDDENLKKIIPAVKKKTKVITFGIDPSADYSYFINSFTEYGFVFTVNYKGRREEFRLNVPGVHNVANAAAAIAIALEYGIPSPCVSLAIENFSGIPRRLEYIGNRGGRAIYYDYAHHPTEISAAISALKLLSKDTLTVVFKPHTYSRTECLWEDFCSSLSMADRVIVTDIFPAREEPIEGINSKRLAADIGDIAEYSSDAEVVFRLDAQHSKGAVVLMGAGDLENIKYDVLNK